MRVPAILIATLALMLTTSCAHRPSGSADAEREQLQQRQTEFLAALAARDVDRTTAHFAEDAVLHVANMPPLQGRDAIHRFYENVFRFMSASEATPEVIRVSSSADMAYSVGSVANVFRGEAGPAEYAGKFLLVWQKREGDWAIAVYGISNNRPDAGR